MKSKVNINQAQEMKRMYEEGATKSEIARKYGYSVGVITRVLESAGHKRNRALTNDEKADIHRLRHEYETSIHVIAREYHISAQRVQEVLAEKAPKSSKIEKDVLPEGLHDCNSIKTKNCIYKTTIDNYTNCCNYCLVELHSRGCEPSRCDKYRPVSRSDKRKKVIERLSAEIETELKMEGRI